MIHNVYSGCRWHKLFSFLLNTGGHGFQSVPQTVMQDDLHD